MDSQKGLADVLCQQHASLVELALLACASFIKMMVLSQPSTRQPSWCITGTGLPIQHKQHGLSPAHDDRIGGRS